MERPILTALILPAAVAPTPDALVPIGLNDLERILAAPGVLNAQRYRLDILQRFPGPYPHHFTICEIDGVQGALAWQQHRATSPDAYLDSSVGVFESMRPRFGAPPSAARTHMLIAMTTPKAGRDDDYNRWYWERHFPDGMRLPGMTSGERFKLRPDLSDAAFPHGYMALYDMHTQDLPHHYAVLNRISRTPEMPLTDALGELFAAWYVVPQS